MALTEQQSALLLNQYEGAEALFLELLPVGADLRADGILAFYISRFETVTSADSQIDKAYADALQEQFNVKAWKIIELVQRAKDTGDLGDLIHLLRVAASIPGQESALSPELGRACRFLLTTGEVPPEDIQLIFEPLTETEARVLIGASIFSFQQNELLPIQLQRILWHIKSQNYLSADDPFVLAGDLAIEAMTVGA
ncbi:MAG: hypothetical protein HYX67_17390 [Candidatus Melainabacteria bacterium]|nr:hypothetical protein [Candidatus Melainabacteria bacterium]